MPAAFDSAVAARDAARAALPRVRRRVTVAGIVQGVGFRPYVFGLATRLDLAGWVCNDGRGLVVEVEGRADRVAEFVERLAREAPPLAAIERMAARDVPAVGARSFTIAESRRDDARETLVSPDTATCADCLRELFDPIDRRFLYPFTNCTACGPRFTIVRDVPYDRPSTTMAAFAMCALCRREYHDPADRRFHAQPNCCPHCGPRLRLLDRDGAAIAGEPIETAAELLLFGRIVAIKGLGGYHLAAADDAAVAALRARKHREDKPFAVMVADLDAARRLVAFDACEAALLTGARRPIVLLERRADAALAPAVAPGNRCLGVMLPYTPLHHLLCHHLRVPFVLTSGNVSDEPIAYDDGDALARLRVVADAFLGHDRPIHTRTDDSVMRVFRGREMPLRRARGCAPRPLILPLGAEKPILACGAELKSTFCLAKGRHAFVSHHIGDLENLATMQAFTDGIAHWQRLFEVAPQVVAHDLHPEYLSTKYALGLDGVERIGVQHHHAHVAACLADNAESGPAIGVAFDGLGYGADGTFWGGEFLLADLADFERAASFEPIPMPGATAAIRAPWRMAAAYLDHAYGGAPPDDLDVLRRNRERWARIVGMVRVGVNSPLTSSVGRLFDAVAALLGVRDTVRYEGQAAIELEQLADRADSGTYGAGIGEARPHRVRGGDFVRAAAEDLRAGVSPARIAARFHNGLAQTVVEVCERLRTRSGLDLVALSGGVFQNVLLAEATVRGLEARGFRVLTHSHAPTNDGGISFGQAVVAAARVRRRGSG